LYSLCLFSLYFSPPLLSFSHPHKRLLELFRCAGRYSFMTVECTVCLSVSFCPCSATVAPLRHSFVNKIEQRLETW
jgi:hypothetical protein